MTHGDERRLGSCSACDLRRPFHSRAYWSRRFDEPVMQATRVSAGRSGRGACAEPGSMAVPGTACFCNEQEPLTADAACSEKDV